MADQADRGSQAASVLVFGSLNVDLVCRVAAIARPGETVLAPDYEKLFGGKGANQAVAAARVLGAANRVAMVGAVGDDELGRAITGNLASEGIDINGLQTAPARTGCAFISIDSGGENAITVASGANARLDASALPDGLLDPSSVLVLQMETPLAASFVAAERAQAKGGRVVVNLAPVPAQLDADDLARLLAPTDYLIVNESELAAAAGLSGIGGDEPGALATALAARFDLVVIATLGAKGALVAEGEAIHPIPALAVEPIDTTGAGDTFVGVFAAGLGEGLSTEAAAERAVVAGSLACRRVGAQSAMPTAAEIDQALATR
ncbi:ribokinase [Aurantimonas sp. E1-2-R+4]|uniref:ribokinase n=1 Tax=Aurantimonas sp. E1-2-R+4 TaxID=3113714 RepID=UPI002F93F35F